MNCSICGYPFDEKDIGQKSEVMTNVIFTEFPKDVCTDVGVIPSKAGFVGEDDLLEGVDLLQKSQIGHLIISGREFCELPPWRGKEFIDLLMKGVGISKKNYTIAKASRDRIKNFRDCPPGWFKQP